MASKHLDVTVYLVDPLRDTYRAMCPCGWDGPIRQDPDDADTDMFTHETLKTFTFAMAPNRTPEFTVDATTVSDAYEAANKHFGYIDGFYAWMGSPNENVGPNFIAMYGVWD